MNLYIKNPQVFRCPSDKVWAFSDGKISYGYNIKGTFGDFNQTFDETPYRHTYAIGPGDIENPSEKIMIADSDGDEDYDYVITWSKGGFVTAGNPIDSKVRPVGNRHNGGANILYVDGHVEWHKQKDVQSWGDANSGPWKVVSWLTIKYTTNP